MSVLRLSAALLLLLGTASAAPVTFRVEVPHCTPDRPIYLRSNRLDVDVVEHDEMTRVDRTHYTVTVDVETPRGQFGYRYSHDICDESACPGIEKALRYDGTGEDLPDRTLGPGDETDDLVFVWRSALRLLDGEGRIGADRSTDERVTFCGPYLGLAETGVSIGHDSYFGERVELEWGLDESFGETLVSEGFRNHFRLPGLGPGTYFYRVTEGGRVGPTHSFVAPPAADDAVHMGVVGDIQYYVEDDRQRQRRLFSVLEGLAPQLVLSAGDVVGSEALNPGFRLPEVGRFNVLFGVVAPVAATAPFMVAMGNHEEDAPLYFDLVDYPHSPGRGRAEHYAFRWGPVHVTALYTGATEGYDFDAITARQMDWMDRTLAEQDAAWQVVLLHRGPFSQGARHPTDGQAFHDSGWGDIWRRHGVDLVIAGHNHNLTVAQHGGIRYVTLCSGAPIHELREPRLPTTIFADDVCAVGRLEADPHRLAFAAYGEDGAVIEPAGFELCAEGGCAPEVDAGVDAGPDGSVEPGDAAPDEGRPPEPDVGLQRDQGSTDLPDFGPPPRLPESDGCHQAPTAPWLLLAGLFIRRRKVR